MSVIYDYAHFDNDPRFQLAMKGMVSGAYKALEARLKNASAEERAFIESWKGEWLMESAVHLMAKWDEQGDSVDYPYTWGQKLGYNHMMTQMDIAIGNSEKRMPGRAHGHATSISTLQSKIGDDDTAEGHPSDTGTIGPMLPDQIQGEQAAQDPEALLIAEETVNEKVRKTRSTARKRRAKEGLEDLGLELTDST